MRLNARVAGSIAFVLGVASCSSATEDFTASPAGDVSQARLAIAPTFSPAAATAYRALVARGADITSIHVVLTDLSGHVALDMRVDFPTTKDTIAIDLPVPIRGREQQFNAQIDLLDATGAIQFSSTQLLTARTSLLPQLPQVTLTLRYVGPGATAQRVTVSPVDATMLPGTTQTVIATGWTAAGAAVGDLGVTWTSSDTNIVRVTSTGSAAGLVSAQGPRGTVTVTAKTLSGIIGSAKVTVVPQAGSLVVVSGNGQTGAALDTLATPFTVELRGTDGGVMSGVLVNFSAVAPGGAVVSDVTSTDALGRASSRLVLGRDVGTYTFRAASGSLAPVTVSETATPATVGAFAQLVPLSSLPPGFTVGVAATQKFSAQLADAKGFYV